MDFEQVLEHLTTNNLLENISEHLGTLLHQFFMTRRILNWRRTHGWCSKRDLPNRRHQPQYSATQDSARQKCPSWKRGAHRAWWCSSWPTSQQENVLARTALPRTLPGPRRWNVSLTDGLPYPSTTICTTKRTPLSSHPQASSSRSARNRGPTVAV